MENQNFNNLNYYNNIDEQIRPPDDTISEVLINNTNFIREYDNLDDNLYDNLYDNLDESYIFAINESIREQKEYEQKQLELLEKTNLRVESFKNVLFKIKKISMIDAEILGFYNMIEPIINEFCDCRINSYECDIVMYTNIFNILKTIRITESELNLFKNLFYFTLL